MARKRGRSKKSRKTGSKTKSKSKGGGRKGSRKGGYIVVLGGRDIFGEVFISEREARDAIVDAISGALQLGDRNSAIRYTKAKVKRVNKEPPMPRKIL